MKHEKKLLSKEDLQAVQGGFHRGTALISEYNDGKSVPEPVDVYDLSAEEVKYLMGKGYSIFSDAWLDSPAAVKGAIVQCLHANKKSSEVSYAEMKQVMQQGGFSED